MTRTSRRTIAEHGLFATAPQSRLSRTAVSLNRVIQTIGEMEELDDTLIIYIPKSIRYLSLNIDDTTVPFSWYSLIGGYITRSVGDMTSFILPRVGPQRLNPIPAKRT